MAGRLRKANNWVVFIRGNHDDPSYFSAERISYKRWRCVPDYSIIKVCGHNVLCIGGATSIDRYDRKEVNARLHERGHLETAVWWPDEAPVYDKDAIDFIPVEYPIDIVITHTAPSLGKATKVWNNTHSSECRVNTTLAKQIALWVTLYSPWQMAADLIENYEGHPAFQFFRDFDPDCDWSEALQGEIGEYIAIARRSGDKFFFGATTNEDGRTLEQPLSFLKPGLIYAATIYADAPDTDWQTNPYAYTIETKEVTSADTLTVTLAPGGGQAISFIPVQ